MISDFTIHLQKICRLPILPALLLVMISSVAYGQLESDKEILVAETLLQKFSQKCSHINNSDTRVIKSIKENLEKAQKEKHIEVGRCIEIELSQIEGLNLVYRNLCSNVTQYEDGIPTSELERLVVDTQQFDNGIRPLVQRMNDCLRVVDHGDDYLIKVVGIELGNRYVLKELNEKNKDLVFRPNRTDFR